MRLRGFTILAVLLLVAACEKPDDLAVIRAAVDDIAQRAQAHDVSGMMAHADEAFVAAPGSRDEQAVRPVLLVAFRRYGKFRVAYPAPGIRLNADGSSADVSVPFVIVREGRSLPDAQLAEIVDDPVAWVAEVTKVAGDPYNWTSRFASAAMPGEWSAPRSKASAAFTASEQRPPRRREWKETSDVEPTELAESMGDASGGPPSDF